jgi:hypothetical protein
LQACGAVDEFADDVGVASVPAGFGGHVHQHQAQGHLALVAPPWHVAGGIERQGADRCVGVRACALVETDDLLACLSLGSPELCVGLGVVFESCGQWLAERAAEGVAEVAGLDAAQVLD